MVADVGRVVQVAIPTDSEDAQELSYDVVPAALRPMRLHGRIAAHVSTYKGA